MEHRSSAEGSCSAVARIGGQPFVYVAAQGDHGTVAKQKAVVLGDTVGNDYVVTSGLNPADKVIVSGIQFLIDGVPVTPLAKFRESFSSQQTAAERELPEGYLFG